MWKGCYAFHSFIFAYVSMENHSFSTEHKIIPLCRRKYFLFQHDAVVVEQHKDGMAVLRAQDAIQRRTGRGVVKGHRH